MVNKLRIATSLFLLLLMSTIIYSVILILSRYEDHKSYQSTSSGSNSSFLPHNSTDFQSVSISFIKQSFESDLTTDHKIKGNLKNSLEIIILSIGMSITGVVMYIKYYTLTPCSELSDLFISTE
jgi:hypothetical protein